MHKQLSLLIFSSCFFLFSNAQITDGLVARYSFNNGNANNDIGPNHAKAVGASLEEDRFGNPKSAYFLHGHEMSYLNLGTGDELKPIAATISVWIKMVGITYSGRGVEVNPIVVTKCQLGDDFFEAYCITIAWNGKKIGAGCTLSELSQIGLSSNEPIKLNEWHHIAFTYDNKSFSLYVNGVLQNTVIKNFQTHFLEGDSVMIGYTANQKNKRFYNGAVDDIEIYNRVLSPEEISILYNAPNPNKKAIIVKRIGYIFLIVLGIVLIVLFFTKRAQRELKKQKEKNKLQRRMYEMEMQIKKAQMNPHFVFNAMNSVQQFILAGDNENAYMYLGKFSKLLRGILESTQEEEITLENEIDLLSKYIEIEALRFKQTFKYEIITSSEINTTKIKIPQMLIQPTVENAIWHGLLMKKDDRKLSIRFDCIDKKVLCCVVEDNGVGRRMASSQNNVLKRKSIAIQFINQRLEHMSKEWKGNYDMQIIDKFSPSGESNGTQVIIRIPIIHN